MNTKAQATVIGTIVLAQDRAKEALKEARTSGDGVLVARDVRRAALFLDHAAEIAEEDGRQLVLPEQPKPEHSGSAFDEGCVDPELLPDEPVSAAETREPALAGVS